MSKRKKQHSKAVQGRTDANRSKVLPKTLQSSRREKTASQSSNGMGEKMKRSLTTVIAGARKQAHRLLTIMFVIVIVTIVFADAFQTNVIVIEPFTLNSELQNKGFDGQRISALLLHNITVMIQEAASIKQAQEFSVPLSAKLPDIELPETRTSVKTVLRYLQEFPPLRYIRRKFGLNPIRVEGDAALQGQVLTINLRISKDVNGKAVGTAKTFTENLDKNSSRVDHLFIETSESILEDAEPYLWAVYLYRTKRTDKAKAQIQYCLSQKGTERAEYALNLWGVILMEEKKYEDAITKLEEVTKYKKHEGSERLIAAAYNNWGLTLLYQHKRDAATSKFEEAIHYDPVHAPAFNNYGKALLEKKETQKGIEKLRQALSLDPNLANAYYNLGYAYWTDKPDEAAALFTASIEHDPNCLKMEPECADAYNALGLLQATAFSPPRFSEAIANLKKAIALDKESAPAWANLGLVLTYQRPSLSVAAGRPVGDEAITDLSEGIRLYESQANARGNDNDFKAAFSKAYNDLGWAYEQRGDYNTGNQRTDYKTAVSNYSKSFEINPAYYYALTGKGDALRKLGAFDSALVEYDNVLKQSEANQETRLVAFKGKGLIFWERSRVGLPATRRKEIELAITMFTEAQKLEVSDEIGKKLALAKTALERLSPAN